ncbi:MAG: hypothetical protein IJ808_05195, partial [Muribaculaceae bacterium]|nr:hypothetical protein [Muribaculaceae bacterium]
MKSFLQQVAQHYANESHLEDLYFIFPNQRGCTFFEQALQNELRHTTLLPQTMPMANFLGRIIGRVQASDLEALLVLYKAYCQVMGKTATPVAKFMQWGSIILNDFNDADLNLVDIYSLFTNVGDLRQISTDYLSPELKQLIGQMLHLNVGSWDDDDDNLWRRQNAGENDGEVKRTYFELWNNLHVIYDQFHRLLQEKGLSTTGHIYRETVRNISGAELENMGISRVVFVGFGYLHASELAIFKTLKDCGRADFWWDDASPIFSNEDQNPAAHYVSRYARLFPSPVVIEPLSFASQTISVVGIPSTVGQAKWAFHHVDQMIESGEIPHPENAIDTAIVLPDDSLFIPVLNSISPQLGQINVTMGYPLRRSSIVSLMHLVAKAHHRATPDTNNHESDFFRDDVKDILSHPIIKMAFTRQAMLALNRLEATNEWRVPASALTSFDFGDLFKPIPDADTANAIFEYINRLTVFCEKLLARIDGEASSHQRENSDNSVLPERTPLQSAFIKQYIDVLSQIKRTFAEHDIAAAGETVFFLVDRLTRTVVIPFEGEPLAGLQIMGLLETRSLDFQNMIVLS